MIQTSRRSLITGLVSFLAAPAVVRAASLMPVKALPIEPVYEYEFVGYGGGFTMSPMTSEMVALLEARIKDSECVMLEFMPNYILATPRAICCVGATGRRYDGGAR